MHRQQKKNTNINHATQTQTARVAYSAPKLTLLGKVNNMTQAAALEFRVDGTFSMGS